MIVTCIDKNYIIDMINSVVLNNNHITILILFINQSKDIINIPPSNHLVTIIEIKSEMISLSKARNRGIDILGKDNINYHHIMFPDDDSSFPSQFFTEYQKNVIENSNYIIDVYNQGKNTLYKKTNHANGDILTRDNYHAAISVNMIITCDTINAVGRFDEMLGVGAKYGAGEDADYFIRACNVMNYGFIYTKDLYNCHPSSANKFSRLSITKTVQTFMNYGSGAIYTLFKHKMYIHALITCFGAIVGVVKSIIRGDLKLLLAYGMAFIARMTMFLKCALTKEMHRNG